MIEKERAPALSIALKQNVQLNAINFIAKSTCVHIQRSKEIIRNGIPFWSTGLLNQKFWWGKCCMNDGISSIKRSKSFSKTCIFFLTICIISKTFIKITKQKCLALTEAIQNFTVFLCFCKTSAHFYKIFSHFRITE